MNSHRASVPDHLRDEIAAELGLETGPSPNALRFMLANSQSPVVIGEVLDREKGGALYQLADGRQFTLTAAECREVGEIRWDL